MQTLLVPRVDVSSSRRLSLAVLDIFSPKLVAAVVATDVDGRNLGSGATQLYLGCWKDLFSWFASVGPETGLGQSEIERPGPV